MAEETLAQRPMHPVWLDPVEPKSRGLDLLGLRRPAQTIGSSLLDGITTATPAVKNLSLRTWLSWSYINARRPDDWYEFRQFCAHAEAAFALGIRLAAVDAQGVVGIDEAARVVKREASEIVLEPYASQIAMQIYANPSDQVCLTFPRGSGVPGITEERGVELAQLVQRELKGCKIGSAIGRGETLNKVHRDELFEFGALLGSTSTAEQENACLIDAILPSSPQPSEVPRLATYAILLAVADNLARAPKEYDFFLEIIDPTSTLPSSVLVHRDGWARYLIRDCLAVCHEATLAAVVLGIDQLQPDPASTVDKREILAWLVSQSAEEAESLRKLGLRLPAGGVDTWDIGHIADSLGSATHGDNSNGSLVNRWSGLPHEWAIAQVAQSLGAGAPICLPITWLLAKRRAERLIREYPANALGSRAGWPRIGVKEVIAPQLAQFLDENWSFLDVVQWLIQRTVDQHLRIAWSRLKAEHPPRDVAVLTSDGQRWCKRRSFSGGRTDSRIPQAISWLRQLGLLEDRGLTVNGRQILERSIQALSSTQ